MVRDNVWICVKQSVVKSQTLALYLIGVKLLCQKLLFSAKRVWIMGYGLWTTYYGLSIMDDGLWSMDYGLCSMHYGLWIMDYGLFMMQGTLSMDYGS